MGRESSISVNVTLAKDTNVKTIERIVLSGSAVRVMKGELII
jgi:hypothetical protein